MSRQSDLTDIYGVKKKRANPLERNNDTAETGFRHSDSYHRFFRGYTEIRRETPSGRIRVERYYTQPWIVSATSVQVYWLTRLVYVGLVLISAGSYLWAMCLDLDSNRAWFVAVPGLPGVILLFLLGAATAGYVFVPRRMTLWDHESSTKRIKTVSLLTGGCLILVAAAKALSLVLLGGPIGGELLSIGTVFFSGICAAAIYGIERGAAYTTVPNETVLPEGEAHEIW